MVQIRSEIFINAPISDCFDLARDIGSHPETVWPHTKEKAVAGVTDREIGHGESVTFEATHFGIRQRLSIKIVTYDRPYVFASEMLQGAFRYIKHTHRFEEMDQGTLMKETLEFASPFGAIGRLFDALILERYMKRFIQYRERQIKVIAENRHGRKGAEEKSC